MDTAATRAGSAAAPEGPRPSARSSPTCACPTARASTCCAARGRRPPREGHRHHRLRLGGERGRCAQGRRLRLPHQAGRPEAVPRRRGVGARTRRRPVRPSCRALGSTPAAVARGRRGLRPRRRPRRTSRAAAHGGSLAGDAARAADGREGRAQHGAVLVRGESGTGKELVARAIHEVSARGTQPFIAVNCSAIPEQLLEAEFFGYRKGAFTGAVDDREGFFQAAKGGTLFLDEIGDLPLSMQSKLLRAIQERCVRPVGASRSCRSTCASSRDAQGPGRRGAGRAVPPGPVLPAERDRDPGAAAARAHRGPAGGRATGARSPRARGGRVAGAAAGARGAASTSSAIRFRATCASSRTCCIARWRCQAERPSTCTTSACPRPCSPTARRTRSSCCAAARR